MGDDEGPQQRRQQEEDGGLQDDAAEGVPGQEGRDGLREALRHADEQLDQRAAAVEQPEDYEELVLAGCHGLERGLAGARACVAGGVQPAREQGCEDEKCGLARRRC